MSYAVVSFLGLGEKFVCVHDIQHSKGMYMYMNGKGTFKPQWRSLQSWSMLELDVTGCALQATVEANRQERCYE